MIASSSSKMHPWSRRAFPLAIILLFTGIAACAQTPSPTSPQTGMSSGWRPAQPTPPSSTRSIAPSPLAASSKPVPSFLKT